MKVSTTIIENDLDRFNDWCALLIKRVQHESLNSILETDIIRQIKFPVKNESVLANIQAWVGDEILKNDLIRTILVLDETIELSKVGANGRPL